MKYVSTYYVCIIYPFFLLWNLFIGFTLFSFSFTYARVVIILYRHLFFCKNRELYDLGTSRSPIEHHWFPCIWSKVGKLVDWLFFQLSKSLRNTDKEFCPVGKLSFSVSVNRKVKNILCYTSDPASECYYQLPQERISVFLKRKKKLSKSVVTHTLPLPST